ncbi:MAG: translation initiation factor IF-3 [bacterium]|nr:translation initiation factor IF-3 [bacterium]
MRKSFNYKKTVKKLRINEQIRVPEVRVIDNAGEQLGVKNTRDAIELASSLDLDLIEVSPLAEPPVCKIMDYGSYQYQQDKKDRKQKAKQKKIEVKGIRLTLKIGPNDLETRRNQAIKFLSKGNKVKIDLILRGREKAHAGRAQEIMLSFADSLAEKENIVVEQDITKQGGRLFMIIGKK